MNTRFLLGFDIDDHPERSLDQNMVYMVTCWNYYYDRSVG